MAEDGEDDGLGATLVQTSCTDGSAAAPVPPKPSPFLLPELALERIIFSKQRLKSAFLGLMSNCCAASAEGYPGTRELFFLLLK